MPGALGAWRRDAVLAAGGYSDESLTEDADLTLTILRRGGRVVYEPEAYGRTEAPESLGALLRQRFRWTYGTYQCLWKHRGAFFKGTLGWVGAMLLAFSNVHRTTSATVLSDNISLVLIGTFGAGGGALLFAAGFAMHGLSRRAAREREEQLEAMTAAMAEELRRLRERVG